MTVCYSNILGCLLGTAVGDACGLRREGLSPRRAKRMFANNVVAPDLFFERGLGSDDTEHTVMVARAWARSGGDVIAFQQQLAWQLRCWLLTAPAGVGLATLRACCKLLLGLGAEQSGVWSAGNGPAMRCGILGVVSRTEGELRQFVRACTRITHTDPRAEAGALLVARAAGLASRDPAATPLMFLRSEVATTEGDELKKRLHAVVQGLEQAVTCAEFAQTQGWANGVSGYINQTVPAAMFCWAASPKDFQQCVSNAVLLGGDTDTVAAITGAICGANLGAEAIPREWIARLAEWPRTVNWLERLADALIQSYDAGQPVIPPRMHWPATLLRNALFTSVVLSLGLRRLLPPY